MVEHVDGAHAEAHVALGVDIVESDPPGLPGIADVGVGIEDDDHLGQRHETLAPHAIHYFPSLAGVLLVDADEDQVVEDPLRRHVVVDDLRQGHAEQRQEDPLGGVTEMVVLHRRPADDRGRIDGALSVGDRLHVDARVVVGQRVEAGVISERTFQHQVLRWIDVPLDDDLRFRGDRQIAGHSLAYFYRLAA